MDTLRAKRALLTSNNISHEFKLKEIEIGHGFLTLYGAPYGDTLQLGRVLAPLLPKPLRELQRDDLRHIKDDPYIFHPYGQPAEVGRKYIRHFHIIYGNRPISKDLLKIDALLNEIGVDTQDTLITNLEDRILDKDLKDKQLKQSKELLSVWLKCRTETITELL